MRDFLPAAAERLSDYLNKLGAALGNKRRRASFATYAHGLLSDGDRKSMEPIAARASGDPTTVVAQHERLIHFLADSPWQDRPIRELAAHHAVQAMQVQGPITSWVLDDTGFLKKGEHSPAVQRQYTGSAGKIANCQIGVSLVLATNHAHVAVDFDLYLPESWAEDRARCEKAHIPESVAYRPKWKIALDLIKRNLEANLPPATVLADSAYGDVPAFRAGLTAMGLLYGVGVHSDTKVRSVGKSGTRGAPMSVKEVAMRARSKFRKCTWREGSGSALSSRFTRHRVVVPTRKEPNPPSQWLLVEWCEGEDEPSKFTLSTLSRSMSCKELVRTIKERWRIEQSYLELKGELGLDHYEGRSYVGWQHHISVVLSCYAFLVAEKVRSFPPSARWNDSPRSDCASA